MHQWQLQEAKAKLSEVVRRACADGPQQILLHGKTKVVVLSQKAYEKLSSKKPNFADFMLKSPLHRAKIKIERDKGFGRDIVL